MQVKKVLFYIGLPKRVMVCKNSRRVKYALFKNFAKAKLKLPVKVPFFKDWHTYATLKSKWVNANVFTVQTTNSLQINFTNPMNFAILRAEIR